jgi:hypothetical protein
MTSAVIGFSAGSFSAGSADALDGRDRIAGLFGDKAVLLFDHGTRGRITIEATKDLAWNSAIGPLRTVFVEHIEQSELCARCGFSCHSGLLSLLNGWTRQQHGHRGNVQKVGRDVVRPDPSALGDHQSLAFEFNVVLRARGGQIA